MTRKANEVEIYHAVFESLFMSCYVYDIMLLVCTIVSPKAQNRPCSGDVPSMGIIYAICHLVIISMPLLLYQRIMALSTISHLTLPMPSPLQNTHSWEWHGSA